MTVSTHHRSDRVSVLRARDGRWETPLGRFIARRGVQRLCAELRMKGVFVEPPTVYCWLSGAHHPRGDVAIALLAIARRAITFEDILSHGREMRLTRGPQKGGAA